MKHNFFTPAQAISDSLVTFPENEAYHATRVLRVQSGDEVAVVDGLGNWYRVSLEVLGRKSVVGQILEHRVGVGEPGYNLHLMVGLLKNLNRFEVMLEKAVELGARSISPFVTKRAQKSRIKMKRAEAILTSAMKQAGRSYLPELTDPIKFKKWYKHLPEEGDGLRLVCHESASPSATITQLLADQPVLTDITMLIGPEGGFDPGEIEQLEEKNFKAVSLGPRRLRTETAAIVASSAIMLSNSRETKA